MTLTFSDATKATIFACDTILGGVRNLVKTYTTGGAAVRQHPRLVSYLTDESKLDGVYITEKVDRKTGWQVVCLRGMNSRLHSGDPGLHGMRRLRPGAAGRHRLAYDAIKSTMPPTGRPKKAVGSRSDPSPACGKSGEIAGHQIYDEQ